MRVSAALLAAYVQCTCAMVFSDFNPLGPKLKSQTPPKYALTAPTTSTQGYAVREKMLSISGEDFYVEREGGGRAFDIVVDTNNQVRFAVVSRCCSVLHWPVICLNIYLIKVAICVQSVSLSYS